MVSFHPCKELGKNVPEKSTSQCKGLRRELAQRIQGSEGIEGWSRECAAEDEGGQGRVRLNHWGLLSHPGVSNLRPLGHMQARVAVNAAQHKIINLLKTL